MRNAKRLHWCLHRAHAALALAGSRWAGRCNRRPHHGCIGDGCSHVPHEIIACAVPVTCRYHRPRVQSGREAVRSHVSDISQQRQRSLPLGLRWNMRPAHLPPPGHARGAAVTLGPSPCTPWPLHASHGVLSSVSNRSVGRLFVQHLAQRVLACDPGCHDKEEMQF